MVDTFNSKGAARRVLPIMQYMRKGAMNAPLSLLWPQFDKVLITRMKFVRYTGYCPRLNFKCGRTYGADTDKLTRVRWTLKILLASAQ
jgi:hypothetical protein